MDKNMMAPCDESGKLLTVAATVNGVTIASYLPWRQYVLASKRYLSTSTVAGIVDTYAKTWLLRVDRPHPGANFPHVNINHYLTKVRDPHARISSLAVRVLGTSQSIFNKVSEWLPTIVTAIDTARVATAVTQDVSKGTFPKETTETATHITGELTGGAFGATAGNKIGATLGGLVGNLPGAAVGSMVGGIAGGIYGTMKGREIAQNLDQDMLVQGAKIAGSATLSASTAAASAAYSAAGTAASGIASASVASVNIIKKVDTAPIYNGIKTWVIDPLKSKL